MVKQTFYNITSVYVSAVTLHLPEQVIISLLSIIEMCTGVLLGNAVGSSDVVINGVVVN